MVVGPEPEQLIKDDIIQRHHRGKLAEFPFILIEGEILTGYAVSMLRRKNQETKIGKKKNEEK